jgi:hypothetical protein
MNELRTPKRMKIRIPSALESSVLPQRQRLMPTYSIQQALKAIHW